MASIEAVNTDSYIIEKIPRKFFSHQELMKLDLPVSLFNVAINNMNQAYTQWNRFQELDDVFYQDDAVYFLDDLLYHSELAITSIREDIIRLAPALIPVREGLSTIVLFLEDAKDWLNEASKLYYNIDGVPLASVGGLALSRIQTDEYIEKVSILLNKACGR